MKTWLKGGIIGGLIPFGIFLLWFILFFSNCLINAYSCGEAESGGFFMIPLLGIISTIIGFGIGSLIGFLVNKIKSRN